MRTQRAFLHLVVAFIGLACACRHSVQEPIPAIAVTGSAEIVAEKGVESASTHFTLTNQSHKPVILSEFVTTTCGCTDAKLNKCLLLPGDQADLEVTMRFNGAEIQHVSADITVEDTKDIISIPITVKYPQFFRSEPHALRLRATENEAFKKTVAIKLVTDSSITEKTIKVLSRPEFVSDEHFQLTKNRDLYLHFTVSLGGIKNTQQHEVVVGLSDESRKLSIPIIINFEPIVSAIPKRIDLTDENCATVVVRTLYDSEITEIKHPNEISASCNKLGTAGRTHIIKLEKHSEKSGNTGELQFCVEYGNPTKKVEQIVKLAW